MKAVVYWIYLKGHKTFYKYFATEKEALEFIKKHEFAWDDHLLCGTSEN